MIDAHIHLSDNRFYTDEKEIIRQAEKNGVNDFFCVSSEPMEWHNVLALSGKYKNIRPFIGTHPWYASKHDPDLFKTLLSNSAFINVGEIGLDTIKGESGQENVFENQLNIAAELNRPCVIHCVKSFDAMAAILKNLKKRPPALLFHGYSGTIQQAVFLMRFNAYFSFSGNLLYPDKRKLQSVFTAIPENRLLIETDAPYMLPPEKFRFIKDEERNLPVNLPLIIQELAKIRKMDSSILIPLLRQNAERFLNSNSEEQSNETNYSSTPCYVKHREQ